VSDTYGTADIYLAAYFRAKGIRFVGHERSGSTIVYFFENIPDLTHMTAEYYTKTAEISPIVIRDNARELKEMVDSAAKDPL
jgi:hypothetical protein